MKLVIFVCLALLALAAAKPYDSKYVITPGGLRPASCVFGDIPSGTVITPRIDESHHLLFPTGESKIIPPCPYNMVPPAPATHPLKRVTSSKNVSAPNADNGWNVYASSPYPGKVTTSLTGYWTVPSDARTQTDQVLYYFTGMQNMFAGNTEIVQPVLQWGTDSAAPGSGKFWGLASWYVGPTTLISKLEKLAVGDSIYGVINQTSAASWDIYGQVSSKGIKTNLVVNKDLKNDWLAVTFEGYNLASCTQYPKSDSVTFTNLRATVNGQEVTPTWASAAPYQNCNENVDIKSPQEVRLHWG